MAKAGGKPTLVIPMRFDGAEALKMLEKLKHAGAEAGEALDDAGEKSRTLGANVAAVLTTQGYQMLKDGAQALAQGYKETAEYIKSISAEFIALRDSMQEVAALKGVQNTGDFTVKQARAAEAASLTPDEWVKFQEQFQSYAGAFISGDQAKLTDAQAEDYQKRLAQFAKARGLSPDQAAQLGGGVLQFAEGPINVDEAMKRFGRAFATLERSPTPVPQLLPQMTRVMAQGADSDQAAQLLSLMSLGMPGEEETGVTNVIKAIDRALTDGKGAELGVSAEMNPLQKAAAAAWTLRGRMASGESELDLMKTYFGDIRERRAIKTLMTQGVDRGGFERVAGYVNETPDDFTGRAIQEYEQSDQGRYARTRAGLAAARIARGDRFRGVEQARLEAERQLTEEGRFEANTWGDMLRANLPIPGLPDLKDQLINERAVSNARDAARASGARLPGDQGADFAHNGFGMTRLGADQSILAALEAQNAMLKKNEERKEREAQKPLTVKPADPVVRPR